MADNPIENFPSKADLLKGSFLIPKNKRLPPIKESSSENIGDYGLVEEIFQNEIGVTIAQDPKPILVTYGLLNCVGLVGFNENQRIGFVMHYQDNTDVDKAFGVLLYNLSRLTKGQQRTFKVRIAGGLSGMSEKLVSKLKAKLQVPIRDDIRFEIKAENVLGHVLEGRNIGIDTRTGGFIESYEPLKNPNHREPPPPEIKEMIFRSTHPSLHYFPKEEPK